MPEGCATSRSRRRRTVDVRRARRLARAPPRTSRTSQASRRSLTETFPLTGERTLPIKFRIAEPAPDGDADRVPDTSDDCPTAPDPVQLDTDADGIGDACECQAVVCAAPPPCHAPAACDPRTGACAAGETATDGTLCALEGGTGVCEAGQCVPAPAPEPAPTPTPTCGTCGGCAGTTCDGGTGECGTCGGDCCGCGGSWTGPGEWRMPMGGMGGW